MIEKKDAAIELFSKRADGPGVTLADQEQYSRKNSLKLFGLVKNENGDITKSSIHALNGLIWILHSGVPEPKFYYFLKIKIKWQNAIIAFYAMPVSYLSHVINVQIRLTFSAINTKTYSTFKEV